MSFQRLFPEKPNPNIGLSQILDLNEIWSAALADQQPPSVVPIRESNPKPPRGRSFSVTKQARTLTVEEVVRYSDEQAHDILCRLRWAGGHPICPRCDCDTSKNLARRGSFRCGICHYEYTVKSGTAWHGAKLTARQILLLCYFFANVPKGIPAITLSIWLGLDYDTVRVALHKIREAIKTSRSCLRLSGIVEIDGVRFTGKLKPPNGGSQAVAYDSSVSRCVISLVQRGGPALGIVCAGETKQAVRAAVQQHLAPDAIIITDEWPAYNFLAVQFKTYAINHSVLFANGDIFTNNAESYHARLRRAQAVYQGISRGPDFDLFIAELAYRHSRRNVDSRSAFEDMVGITLREPPTSFRGYWN